MRLVTTLAWELYNPHPALVRRAGFILRLSPWHCEILLIRKFKLAKLIYLFVAMLTLNFSSFFKFLKNRSHGALSRAKSTKQDELKDILSITKHKYFTDAFSPLQIVFLLGLTQR